MLTEFAPAKINLYLHITGRRQDGYHVLDSLVAFAGIGDEVRLKSAKSFDFAIEGPRAAELKGAGAENNLVVRAAKCLAELTGKPLDVRLVLIKNLPVASGIGGGSSDAAAVLRALATHWQLEPNDPRILEAARLQGEDTPLCLAAESCYMGEGAEASRELPHADIVLANPGKPLSTAEVYKAYREGGFAFSPAARIDSASPDAADLAAKLRKRRNDLMAPALKLMPEIGKVLGAIESTGALLARMSGSGATCFGIYPDRGAAREAAAVLAKNPGWWVMQSHIPCQRDRRRRS